MPKDITSSWKFRGKFTPLRWRRAFLKFYNQNVQHLPIEEQQAAIFKIIETLKLTYEDVTNDVSERPEILTALEDVPRHVLPLNIPLVDGSYALMMGVSPVSICTQARDIDPNEPINPDTQYIKIFLGKNEDTIPEEFKNKPNITLVNLPVPSTSKSDDAVSGEVPSTSQNVEVKSPVSTSFREALKNVYLVLHEEDKPRVVEATSLLKLQEINAPKRRIRAAYRKKKTVPPLQETESDLINKSSVKTEDTASQLKTEIALKHEAKHEGTSKSKLKGKANRKKISGVVLEDKFQALSLANDGPGPSNIDVKHNMKEHDVTMTQGDKSVKTDPVEPTRRRSLRRVRRKKRTCCDQDH